MALKYVVKKTTFGFDDTKAEKYVARPFNVVNVDFKMLCDQVTKVGFVPRGTVKAVLDGLIDSLITYMEIGASVNLGEFGTFRPSFGCKSQENAEEVTTETLKNRKIIFTPGELLKNMIKSVSIQKLDVTRNSSSAPSAEFQHIIYLFATDTVRVVNVTVGTGDGNHLGTQFGSLGSSTPSHISKTGDSHGLALDVNAFCL